MSKVGDAIDRHYDELERQLITRKGIYGSPNDPSLQTPEGFMSFPADHMAPQMLLSGFKNPATYKHTVKLQTGDIAVWLPGLEWVFFLRPKQWEKDPGGLYGKEVICTLPVEKLTVGKTHVFTGLVKLGRKFNLTMETIKPLQDLICRFKSTS